MRVHERVIVATMDEHTTMTGIATGTTIIRIMTDMVDMMIGIGMMMFVIVPVTTMIEMTSVHDMVTIRQAIHVIDLHHMTVTEEGMMIMIESEIEIEKGGSMKRPEQLLNL
jgi:hypothetical protein